MIPTLQLGGLGRRIRSTAGGGGGGGVSTWDAAIAALPNLWGWWKLDETAAAAVSAVDSSGNGRHYAYTASGTRVAGLFSGSTYAQTLGGRVFGPTWTPPTTPKFTAGAVIKTTAGATEQQIFSADQPTSPRLWQFNKVSTGGNTVGFVIITPSVVAINGTTAINDGNPHLAIITFDQSLSAAAGRMKIYVDGVLEASSTTSVTMTAGNAARMAIGARYNGFDTGLWSGSIDDAFFCDTAISAADVAALWALRNA